MILQSTCINKDLPYKERFSPPRNEGQLYTTTKTQKPSQIKIRIIYPSSATLELWKFSNLTFRGYLTSTTPVLSTRSFLFLFCRFYLEHVRTVRLTNDFQHHQLLSSVGKVESRTVTAILPLRRQRVVWYSLTRWQPITIPEKNHALLPLKDRYRP